MVRARGRVARCPVGRRSGADGRGRCRGFRHPAPCARCPADASPADAPRDRRRSGRRACVVLVVCVGCGRRSRGAGQASGGGTGHRSDGLGRGGCSTAGDLTRARTQRQRLVEVALRVGLGDPLDLSPRAVREPHPCHPPLRARSSGRSALTVPPSNLPAYPCSKGAAQTGYVRVISEATPAQIPTLTRPFGWAVRDSNPRPLARHGPCGSSIPCFTASPGRKLARPLRGAGPGPQVLDRPSHAALRHVVTRRDVAVARSHPPGSGYVADYADPPVQHLPSRN